MDKRGIVGIVLIVVLVFAWMYYQSTITKQNIPEKMNRQNQQVPADTQGQRSRKADTATSESTAQTQNGTKVDPVAKYGKVFAPFAQGEREVITVENDLLTAKISTKGADLIKWRLKEYKTWDGNQVQLIWDREGELFMDFVTYQGKSIDTRDFYFDFLNSSNKKDYRVTGKDSLSLTFVLQIASNKSLVKKLTFYGNDYSIDTKIILNNLGDIIPNRGFDYVWEDGLAYQEENSVDESQSAEAVVQLNGDAATYDADGVGEVMQRSETGIVDYAAVKTKYFTAAMIPSPWQSFDGTVDVRGEKFNVKNSGQIEKYDISFRIPYAGGKQENNFKVYIGPIDYNVVSDYGLESVVNLGWKYGIRQIGEYFMIPIFTFIHRYIPNYGFSIIIFSIIIKLLLYPLSIQQMRSAQKMKLLQPEMSKIREKYKDDNTKQQQEIMKMYSSYGVNPVGGCLPMLLQMPILFALWSVLRNAIELRQSEFILWINDLSTPDVILDFGFSFMGISQFSGLAILMGVTMFFQQKLTITDPKQKAMVYFMPVFFVFLFSNFPSGLNLYYFMFNLLGIGQQVYINKFSKKSPTLDEMKKKPKKESWLQKKMREAQEIAEAQGKGTPGKKTGSKFDPNPNYRKKGKGKKKN